MKKAIMFTSVFFLSLLMQSACIHSSDSLTASLLSGESCQNKLCISIEDFAKAKMIEENKYYKIVYSDNMYYYCIINKDSDVVKSEGPFNKQPRISIVDGLVKVTLQAGTGLGTQWGFFYDTNDNVFSQIFQCIYDQCDGKVAVGGMNKVIVRDIFDESQYYKGITSFNESFSEMVEPITGVRFLNDGKSIEVLYLAGDNYQKVIEIIDLD